MANCGEEEGKEAGRAGHRHHLQVLSTGAALFSLHRRSRAHFSKQQQGTESQNAPVLSTGQPLALVFSLLCRGGAGREGQAE